MPSDHPLRAVRQLVDEVLERMSAQFATLYSHTGRPSIAPEHLLKASLLQAFFSIRSERQLVEQIDYNILFRWFVGSVDGCCGLGCLDLFQEPRPADSRRMWRRRFWPR